MKDFDPFNMKSSQRQCPRCADGRLHPDPIGDLKVNLYCDTCSYSKIYTRPREHKASPAVDPYSSAKSEIPESPKPAATIEAPTVPPAEPATSTKEAPVAKTNTRNGLDPKSYQRWFAAGKPNVAAFKEAGCPTASNWKKLQAKSAAASDTEPTPASEKPAKTSPRPPAAKPARAATPTKPESKTSSCSIQIKALHVSYEGDAADIPALLQNFVNLLK